MAQKTPTLWDSNTAKNDGVAYSSSSVTYNSSTTSYSSSTVGTDEYGKVASTWTPASKTATSWLANTTAVASIYAYDSASRAYDSTTDTYDGTGTDLETLNTNTPTVWSVL